MELVVAGVDLVRAPLALRAAIDDSSREDLLSMLAALPDVEEAAVVAGGCRYEAYVAFRCGFDSFELLAGAFSEHLRCQASQVAGCLYAAEGIDAVMHAIHAACGSDSFSQAKGHASRSFRLVCESSHAPDSSVGVMVRLATVAEGASERFGSDYDAFRKIRASAEMAVGFARLVFDDLEKCNVMVAGSNYAAPVFHASFTQAGAKVFAGPAAGESLVEAMAKADVSLLCDGSALGLADAKRVRRARRGRLSVVFDLSERGCVDQACARIDDVFVYGRADLADAGESAGGFANGSDAECVRAIRILAADYMKWLEGLTASSER